MPKKKTGQRKKHDKMKARQKEIGLRGERKDHLNIAERCHSQSFAPVSHICRYSSQGRATTLWNAISVSGDKRTGLSATFARV